MLNTLIPAGGTISPPTNVHLISTPAPPNSVSSGLFTLFTMTFDADPTISTYCEVYENGVLLSGALAPPGATSIDVVNAAFASSVSITGKAIHSNQASLNG